MKPEIQLLGRAIPTYSLFYYGALPVFLALSALLLRRRGERSAAPVDLALLMGLGYTAGARVLAAIAGRDWAFFIAFDPGKLQGALWGGQAAFAALGLAYVLVARARVSTLGDALAVGWAFATVLHKTACFFAGCCDGAPTDLPWGIVFPKGSQSLAAGTPVHPTQLYDAGAALLLGAALAVAFARGRARGRLVLWWGLGFAVTRFASEFTRSEVRFPIAPRVSAAMPSEIVAMVITAALLLRPAPWDRWMARLDARATSSPAPPDLATRGRVMVSSLGDAIAALALAGATFAASQSLVAPLAVWLAYYVLGNVALGAAPLSRALGLRSARADGSRPALPRRLLRGLGEALGPITGIGLLRPLFDPARRPLGDALAGTFPVRAVLSAGAPP